MSSARYLVACGRIIGKTSATHVELAGRDDVGGPARRYINQSAGRHVRRPNVIRVQYERPIYKRSSIAADARPPA